MVQKEVQELKEISKIIDNGVYNIALAKAVQGGAYMGDAPGENMVDVGKWQYTEFIHKITVSSIITNTSATFLSLATDMGLKSIKEKFYKKQEDKVTEKLREKFDRYINGPTKVGGCFVK